jgi:uncharacterized protein (TIGR03032 family)
LTDKPTTDSPESTESEDKTPDSFQYSFSDSVTQILAQSQASLWVSTYQAGKLAVFRVNKEGKLSLLLRTFDKAMGMALSPRKLAIGTRHQVWHLVNEPALAAKIEPKGDWQACYMPRSSHVTGYVDIHELAWGGADGNELWFVNTLYSALCTVSPDCSFVPRWRPPFISELRKHDRCHLNGLAMVDGVPAYVTAFSETDSPSGWREGNHKSEGGVVIDIASGEIISRGLSMPHSPRYYEGRLWLLDSGNGRLVTVDPSDGSRETIAELPGYTRGLTFLGRYAFIGLSRIRETAIFGGIPIAENLDDRKCGIWVVDIITGEISGFIEFHETVDEVFDVQVLPGIVSPMVIGLEKDDVEKRCIIGAMDPLVAVEAKAGETGKECPSDSSGRSVSGGTGS